MGSPPILTEKRRTIRCCCRFSLFLGRVSFNQWHELCMSPRRSWCVIRQINIHLIILFIGWEKTNGDECRWQQELLSFGHFQCTCVPVLFIQLFHAIFPHIVCDLMHPMWNLPVHVNEVFRLLHPTFTCSFQLCYWRVCWLFACGFLLALFATLLCASQFSFIFLPIFSWQPQKSFWKTNRKKSNEAKATARFICAAGERGTVTHTQPLSRAHVLMIKILYVKVKFWLATCYCYLRCLAVWWLGATCAATAKDLA